MLTFEISTLKADNDQTKNTPEGARAAVQVPKSQDVLRQSSRCHVNANQVRIPAVGLPLSGRRFYRLDVTAAIATQALAKPRLG